MTDQVAGPCGSDSSAVLGAVAEARECPDCHGKGWSDVWRKVAGHYDGREEFREDCSRCEGMGRLADDAAPAECQAPPLGWRCTRGDGHEGPCAAVECPEELAMIERAMQRLRGA